MWFNISRLKCAHRASRLIKVWMKLIDGSTQVTTQLVNVMEN